MITATKVTNHAQRMKVLPTFFGVDYMRFEGYLYDNMSTICDKYNGGTWSMYLLSNGSMYMTPNIEGVLEIAVPTNFYRGKMSAEAAGITSSLYAINRLCRDRPEETKYADMFYALRDFAIQHPECGEIMGAID